jgi:hypothetical protein
MGLVLFYGCVLIAYGPLLAMFLTLFRSRSSLVILMMGRYAAATGTADICSSFFWLLSALLAGLLWTLLSTVLPMFIFLLLAVGLQVISDDAGSHSLMQEAFRFVFWKLSTYAVLLLFVWSDSGASFAEPGLFSRTSPARAPLHRLHVATGSVPLFAGG